MLEGVSAGLGCFFDPVHQSTQYHLNSAMTTPRKTVSISLLLLIPLGLSACSDSNADQSLATPAFEADTSYLDDLATDEGIEIQKDEPQAESTTSPNDLPSEPEEKEYKDEDREWTAEEGSKSIFGRARDKAKNVVKLANDSTEPENGVAITAYDEEYAQAAGHAWDMPEGWRMAVPTTGHFAEMYIQNQLGNASVVFSKESGTLRQIRRTLEATMTDTFGGSSKTITTKKTIQDFPVTFFELNGTYLDPSGKGNRNGSPFYAIHAAVIELPTTKILIKLWGPEDTVKQNKYLFDTMIEKMYER